MAKTLKNRVPTTVTFESIQPDTSVAPNIFTKAHKMKVYKLSLNLTMVDGKELVCISFHESSQNSQNSIEMLEASKMINEKVKSFNRFLYTVI